MAGDAEVTATGSSARLRAQGDITLGNVTATNVSILSNAGAIVNSTGSGTNVTATTLRLQSDDAIGADARPLTTDVGTLSARSTGTDGAGIFISESSEVTVASVAVTVQEFTALADTVPVDDAAQSDLVAGNGGDIKLLAAGTITLEDDAPGQTGDGQAVSTTGDGRIELQSTGGTVVVNTAINTESGSVDLRSKDSIQWGEGGTVKSDDPAPDTQLTVRPVEPGQDLLVGGTAAGAGTGWRFAPEDLSRLQTGYDRIVIGGDDFTGKITVDGTVTADGVPQMLTFTNPVEIKTAPGAGAVEVKGRIKADSLTVDGDAPVRFSDVTLDLTQPEGLKVQGAASFSGDVTITASKLAFEGGAGSLTGQPGATLTLLPEDPAQTIVVGSGAAVAVTDFALGTRELAALGNGFSSIEIGRTGRAADLRVEGNAAFTEAVTLWGRTVTMAEGSTITSSDDITVVAAGDVTLGSINAAGRTVTVRAEGAGATVASQAGTTGVNVVATSVVLEGFGPVDGAGSALRVTSDNVNVFTPTGMVLRQTQTNGEVHFLVMVDGKSYLQVVNTQRNAVAAGTSTLASVQSTQGTVAPLAQFGDRMRALSAGAGGWAGTAQSASVGTSAGAQYQSSPGTLRALAATSRLATADITWTSTEDGDDERLRHAFLLGQPGAQPGAAGLSTATHASFDYWVENLTL